MRDSFVGAAIFKEACEDNPAKSNGLVFSCYLALYKHTPLSLCKGSGFLRDHVTQDWKDLALNKLHRLHPSHLNVLLTFYVTVFNSRSQKGKFGSIDRVCHDEMFTWRRSRFTDIYSFFFNYLIIYLLILIFVHFSACLFGLFF